MSVGIASFRAAYAPTMDAAEQPFRLHVIGYQMTFEHVVDVPSGHGCFFMHMLLDPVPILTPNGVVEAPAPCVYIIWPNQALYHGTTEHSYRHSWLRCSGTRVEGWLRQSGFAHQVPVKLNSIDESHNWLLAMHQEMHHPKGGDEEAVRAMFEVWVRTMARDSVVQSPSISPALLKARHFIETQFSYALTLQDIVDHVGVSRSWLCKAFQDSFGTTPMDYALSLRLSTAKELLLDANTTVSQVAADCGFNDIYYFSRWFKQKVGVSPTVYRKGQT